MHVHSWAELTGAVRPDYDGMTYLEREALKRDASRRLCEATTPAAKANAMEDIIRAHYDRSRECYRGRHPGFVVYACHWVAAEAQCPLSDLGAEVCAELTRRYPPPTVRHIADGQTSWMRTRVAGA